jgi:hypothetical protein
MDRGARATAEVGHVPSRNLPDVFTFESGCHQRRSFQVVAPSATALRKGRKRVTTPRFRA